MTPKNMGNAVVHSCPVLGRQILIDTDVNKSCLSCKFKVSNLVIKSHRHMRIAHFSNCIPVIFLVGMILFTEIEAWIPLVMVAPMHVAILFAGRYLIAQNSLDWHRALAQESLNWNRRK